MLYSPTILPSLCSKLVYELYSTIVDVSILWYSKVQISANSNNVQQCIACGMLSHVSLSIRGFYYYKYYNNHLGS